MLFLRSCFFVTERVGLQPPGEMFCEVKNHFLEGVDAAVT